MGLGDPYVTVQELKGRLGIVDAVDDAALQGAVHGASRAINQFCKRQFQRADEAAERRYPALSDTLLLVDDFHSTEDLTVGGVAFSEEEFALEPPDGVVDGEPGWPFWRIRGSSFFGRVTVSARWGWPAVPASITEAAFQTALEIFKMRDAPFGVQNFADLGLIRVRENHRISQQLAPYRRRPAEVA